MTAIALCSRGALNDNASSAAATAVELQKQITPGYLCRVAACQAGWRIPAGE